MSINSKLLKLYKYFTKNYRFITKILFIIIISVIIFYLIERYIIYNIIYYLLLLLSRLIFIQKYNYFYIKFESIIISIYLHILLIRIVVLSIIFMQGGIFKKILVSEQFYSFISAFLGYSNHIVENLSTDNNENVDFFMDKLDVFRQCYQKLKPKNINMVTYAEDYLNDIYNKYNSYKINKSEESKENLIEALNNFSNNMGNLPTLSLLERLFSFNYHDSLKFMEEYMINSFKTHFVEKKAIDKNFEIFVISPKNPDKKNDILTIFCNQNAICCEIYSIGKDNIYYYLNELNCTIILWNYTGFGLRKGLTTFGNTDKDVEKLSNYIKNNFKKYKIIIHGCSIGGYSSIKLAQKLISFNDIVLISDRTFGDIKNIVQSLNYNKILTVIYDMIFPHWFFKYNNIDNYISLPYNKKLILFDENDEIIKYNNASLVFNITQKYYSDIIKPKLIKYKDYFSLIQNTEKFLYKLTQLSIDSNNEKFNKYGRIFVQHLYYYINSIELFFMLFITFGYPFNHFKEIYINFDKIKDKCMEIPIIFKKILQSNDIIDKEISDIISAFNFIYMKINLSCSLTNEDILGLKYNDKKSFLVDQNHLIELKKYFGNVHRIHCGHNGKLESKDFKIIKEFLKDNEFI